MALDFTVTDTMHKVVAKFTPNHLPDAKKPYVLRAVFQPEMDVHGIASKAAMYNIETDPKVIEEGMNAGFEILYYLLADGYKVKTPLCSVHLRLPGEYEGCETSLADGARPELRIQAAFRLREYIAGAVRVEFDGVDTAAGLIAEALDEQTGQTDEVASIGGLLTIRGSGLKIEADDAHRTEMGVFFQPAGGGAPLKAEVIAVNQPRTLKVIVPAALSPGADYYLRILTMSPSKHGGGLLKQPRDIESAFMLTAQAQG